MSEDGGDPPINNTHNPEINTVSQSTPVNGKRARKRSSEPTTSSSDTDAAVRDEFLIRLEQIRKMSADEQKKDSCDIFGAMIATELRNFDKMRQIRIRRDIEDVLLKHAEEVGIEETIITIVP